VFLGKCSKAKEFVLGALLTFTFKKYLKILWKKPLAWSAIMKNQFVWEEMKFYREKDSL